MHPDFGQLGRGGHKCKDQPDGLPLSEALFRSRAGENELAWGIGAVALSV